MHRIFSPVFASYLRLAAIAGTAAVLRLLPASMIAAAPVICPFRRFAGIECYGCGMTRALHSFVQGDIGLAVGFNGLVVPLVVLALGVIARDLLFLLERTTRLQAAADGASRRRAATRM